MKIFHALNSIQIRLKWKAHKIEEIRNADQIASNDEI